jgi:hypothetical protein
MVRVHWLAKPVPLIPGGGCKIKVWGVSWDAPRSLTRDWLQRGKSATKGASDGATR